MLKTNAKSTFLNACRGRQGSSSSEGAKTEADTHASEPERLGALCGNISWRATQVKMEAAKHSLYRAQQELLTKVHSAEVRERERAAELAAEAAARRAQDAAQRARQAQETARLEARRREMEQQARQATATSLFIILLMETDGVRRQCHLRALFGANALQT